MLLVPKKPFNLALTCAVFSKGDPEIEIFDNNEYRKVIHTAQGPFLLKVAEINNTITVNSEDEEVINTAKFILDTDTDINQFYEAIRGDPILSAIASQLSGMRIPSTASAFEALIYAITEQQIALKAAISIENRIIKKFGIKHENHYAFPLPEALASASIEDLRSCGLSNRKVEYVKGVAQTVLDGLDLEKLKLKSNEEVIETLTKIRGVGLWTAEYAMARGMKKSAIPAGDLGLRKAIGRLYFAKDIASEEECREISKKWKNWLGYASYYLFKEKSLLS